MIYRPRVAFWTACLYASGGTEIWHQTLMSHLDRDRIDLVGLGIVNPDEYAEDRAQMMAGFCPVVIGPDACERLAEETDVLVMWGLGQPCEILPECSKRPKVVFVSHGDGNSFWTVHSCRQASVDVDIYVAVSREARNAIPADRRAGAVVIPNGVELARLSRRRDREEQRRIWGVPPEAKVLGYLGRTSEEKCPEALARCVRELPEEWVGVLVGDSPEFPQVRADAFVLTQRVYFPGPQNDVGSALSAFDVVLMPSRGEGFGYSAVEGLMAAVPVVSTLTGIIAEHADLVRPIPIGADGPTIAAAVLADQADPGRPERVRRAREVTKTLYGAARFGQRWSRFLADLGGKPRDPDPDDVIQSQELHPALHREPTVPVSDDLALLLDR